MPRANKSTFWGLDWIWPEFNKEALLITKRLKSSCKLELEFAEIKCDKKPHNLMSPENSPINGKMLNPFWPCIQEKSQSVLQGRLTLNLVSIWTLFMTALHTGF